MSSASHLKLKAKGVWVRGSKVGHRSFVSIDRRTSFRIILLQTKALDCDFFFLFPKSEESHVPTSLSLSVYSWGDSSYESADMDQELSS